MNRYDVEGGQYVRLVATDRESGKTIWTREQWVPKGEDIIEWVKMTNSELKDAVIEGRGTE